MEKPRWFWWESALRLVDECLPEGNFPLLAASKNIHYINDYIHVLSIIRMFACKYMFIYIYIYKYIYGSVSKTLVPLVNIKIAGKWMFIPLKMVLIGIDPYPYIDIYIYIYMCTGSMTYFL